MTVRIQPSSSSSRQASPSPSSGGSASAAPRSSHPYLAGNFHPVKKENELTPCRWTGAIPEEVRGGQYLRNGGNPQFSPEEGRDYHWFDGDGMLHGVFFRRVSPFVDGLDGETVVPCYVNKFIKTDVFEAGKKRGATILPSISSLISLDTSKASLLVTLLRAVWISYLAKITRLSVANTSTIFHSRRLLATCESGPPIRISAPSLDTIGWWIFPDENCEDPDEKGGLGVEPLTMGRKGKGGFGVMGMGVGMGDGLDGMLEEWTTGHPKVDPDNGDLIFYGYNIFQRPFVHYSVISSTGSHKTFKQPINISRPKMMHDFAVSKRHSIILDLPLTMDPFNPFLPSLMNRTGKSHTSASGGGVGGKPMVYFDRSLRSRFGVLPRLYGGKDEEIKWFESEPCLIFHTANCWDTPLPSRSRSNSNSEPVEGAEVLEAERDQEIVAVNLLACRFKTAKLVHASGGMRAPEVEEEMAKKLDDVVRLTYYRFSMLPQLDTLHRSDPITHEFALSTIPFEFPLMNPKRSMKRSRFVYGCTMREGSFDAALEGAKVDCIVKIDVEELVGRGMREWEEGKLERGGIVDCRSVLEILEGQEMGSATGHAKEGKIEDPVKVFSLPPNHYAQEPTFVPRSNARSEDDGYLIFYVYDESQLLPNGDAPDESSTELWILDALKIGETTRSGGWCDAGNGGIVIGKITLPQRVPYGLHSDFITEEMIDSQRQEELVMAAKGKEREGVTVVAGISIGSRGERRRRRAQSVVNEAAMGSRVVDQGQDILESRTRAAVEVRSGEGTEMVMDLAGWFRLAWLAAFISACLGSLSLLGPSQTGRKRSLGS